MIHLSCRGCGADTDSDHSREALCFICLARSACAADLAECSRLLSKRRRWRGRPGGLSDQMRRASARLQAHVYLVVGEPGQAQAVYESLVRELDSPPEAQSSVHVPREGALGRAILQAAAR